MMFQALLWPGPGRSPLSQTDWFQWRTVQTWCAEPSARSWCSWQTMLCHCWCWQPRSTWRSSSGKRDAVMSYQYIGCRWVLTEVRINVHPKKFKLETLMNTGLFSVLHFFLLTVVQGEITNGTPDDLRIWGCLVRPTTKGIKWFSISCTVVCIERHRSSLAHSSLLSHLFLLATHRHPHTYTHTAHGSVEWDQLFWHLCCCSLSDQPNNLTCSEGVVYTSCMCLSVYMCVKRWRKSVNGRGRN